MTNNTADLAIIGGGVAGMWTLRRALAAGYNAVLFEAGTIGGEQTLASQGMIHGGLKYALAGLLNSASEAIAGMPARWRACLDGRGEIDLGGLPLASDRYYMFAAADTLGKLTTFFASRSLRGRIRRLRAREFPSIFEGFDGVLYELSDFVLDTGQLMRRLGRGVENRLFRQRIDGACCSVSGDGFRIELGDEDLHVRRLVNCGGNGGGELAQALAPGAFPMQQRPLHQVIVRTRLPSPLFAHCLTGISRPEPRLTLTTHPESDGDVLYIGGQLATDGVQRSQDEQIHFARQELLQCLPWLDFAQARISTLRIERAEPRNDRGLRPDQAFVDSAGALLQCWPTKLSLAPDLADRVLALLPPPMGGEPPVLGLPTPGYGVAPWTGNR